MISNKSSTLWLAALVALALLALAGCTRREAAPTPTAVSVVVPPFDPSQGPPEEATVDVDKAKGGTIALQDGAQVTLPADALTENATVTFRTADDSPGVPIPDSIIGRAYELQIDGSDLTGVALLRMPLPPGVTPDQYELAPYRWTGRLWERVTARDVTGGIQFGANTPGVYALLGHWKLADATLALLKPDTVPGQQSIPLTAAGQYRYSAIPALQDGLVPAQLVLKQDSSGGAGLVAGDPNQDETVDQTTLYFKPDPSQSDGVIQFQHIFDLAPGLLNLDPGVNTRFYLVLTVEDAAAPTRRTSNGIEYTQILPIRIQNMEVVRPVVLQEERVRFRWKIMLNGLIFQTPEARGPTLALQPIIDQGGVGDYSVVLEVENEGGWTSVSNELSVQLALRPTDTPPPGSTPTATPQLVAIDTPVIPSPIVPTRRPTPAGGGSVARVTPTAVVTASAMITPTATPTRPDWANVFWADKYAITTGECTILHWKVENVISVMFNGEGVTGEETRRVCPTQTTTYTLRVTDSAGSQDRTITLQVGAAGQPAIVFTADKTQVASGGCTILRWSATDVREVRLNGDGVQGIDTKQVCPQQTTDYELSVLTNASETITRRLTIAVVQGSESSLNASFWAQQYTLPGDDCTTLHWRVENVQSVFLDGEGVPGVGTREVCPAPSSQSYILEINEADGTQSEMRLVVASGDPLLAGNEIIAQGVVNEVSRQNDVSPNEAGDQPGYVVVIDGIALKFSGIPGFNQGAVRLSVPQSIIDQGDSGPLHWPVRPTQQVEFRGTCEAANCSIDPSTDSYLYVRSE